MRRMLDIIIEQRIRNDRNHCATKKFHFKKVKNTSTNTNPNEKKMAPELWYPLIAKGCPSHQS